MNARPGGGGAGRTPGVGPRIGLILQQPRGDAYVVATGEAHKVRELREEAFDFAKLDYRKHVELDPRYLRPTEVDCLLGDASRGCQPAPASLQWVRKVPGTRTCRARR